LQRLFCNGSSNAFVDPKAIVDALPAGLRAKASFAMQTYALAKVRGRAWLLGGLLHQLR
jgi:hypothetical protein